MCVGLGESPVGNAASPCRWRHTFIWFRVLQHTVLDQCSVHDRRVPVASVEMLFVR